MMNTLKVVALLAALTALFVGLGSWIGGPTGAAIAFLIALAMNFATYWFSDRMVISMTRARPVSPSEAPELYAMVDRLSRRAGIPTPSLYVVPDPSPNAFATGRDPKHAAVAVNEGLLRILDRPEVEGVIAHELAHIKHRDTLTMTVVATVVGAIVMIANIAQFAAIFGQSDEDSPNPLALLLMALVAPLAATILQLAISRAREYEADRLGAQIAGSPRGLANALLKLERSVEALPGSMPPQAAHLCIVSPLAGIGGMVASLFRTHPLTEDRVRRLMALEGGR
ncbi:MAG: zinc metalloprotease HtpX [Fimbriimonadales bacterium]|nr:zinc metalloprotease HtpX [Fimbriimonadales bacterium]